MKKIIIIDDEVHILNVLQTALSKDNDYQVDIFSNPYEALELIKKNRYDLLLLDIMMPSINGLELLDKIKEIKPNLEVVMMTAYNTMEKTIEAYEKGAKNYIEKPFESMIHLKNTLDKIIYK
ncbi:MAG: response regulator [Campylobacterota bacterium]|nr:response regulator [Campylobacterota bacterium]